MKMTQAVMPETDKVFKMLEKGQFPNFLELIASLDEISSQNTDEDARCCVVRGRGIPQHPPGQRCKNC